MVFWNIGLSLMCEHGIFARLDVFWPFREWKDGIFRNLQYGERSSHAVECIWCRATQQDSLLCKQRYFIALCDTHSPFAHVRERAFTPTYETLAQVSLDR